jgi:drug/metabolite transporter (DMT)-like permease
MDKQRLATLYGIAVALLWGMSFLSIKVAVAVVPPMTMAVLRFTLACAVLPLFAILSGESLKVSNRDLPLLMAGGFTGVTLYFLGENNGVALLTASESSLIIGSIPVLTVLAEEVFLKSRVGVRVHIGAIVSFLGVALIVAPSLGSQVQRLGYLYMAMAALAWVAYTFLTRGVAARYGKITVIFWQCLFGLLGCIPFALMEARAWQVPGPAVILHLLYLGLICSAAGYWLYASALDRLGVGRSSVFINLIPVVSVVASFFLLGERLGPYQLVGGAIAVVGVYLATVTSGSPSRAVAQRD